MCDDQFVYTVLKSIVCHCLATPAPLFPYSQSKEVSTLLNAFIHCLHRRDAITFQALCILFAYIALLCVSSSHSQDSSQSQNIQLTAINVLRASQTQTPSQSRWGGTSSQHGRHASCPAPTADGGSCYGHVPGSDALWCDAGHASTGDTLSSPVPW